MYRTPKLAALLAIDLILQAQTPTPDIRRALNSIHPAELKGDLSFLASDLLEGRYTPSPGLEIAAEFIASKFRAAGLEPAGDKDYFQQAVMLDRTLPRVTTPIMARDVISPSQSNLTRSA